MLCGWCKEREAQWYDHPPEECDDPECSCHPLCGPCQAEQLRLMQMVMEARN